MTRDEVAMLRAHIATLEQLLEAHEDTALDQTARLAEERARFRQFFMDAPAAIAIFMGPDRVIEFANAGFGVLLPHRDDFLGRPLLDVFPELKSQGLIELLDNVFETGEPYVAHESRIMLDRLGDGQLSEGYFTFSWTPVRDPDGTVSGVLAHAVEVTDIVRSRKRAEDLAADLRGLADVSLTLASARSVDEVLQEVVDQARSIVGSERSFVSILPGEEGALDATATSSVRHGLRPAESTAGTFGEGLASRIRESRQTLRLSASDIQELWSARPVDDGMSPPRDWLGAPLSRRDGGVLGVLVLMDRIGGGFTQSDESVVAQIASMASVAIENARLYEREHQIAETLQRSLLPEVLPQVPGLQIAARYRPGGKASEVGGDWFDVIPLPDGRVGLALGDVVGRGVRAASVMGQLRMAIRAYAVGGGAPSSILQRADRLLQGLDRGQMATVLYMVWDPDAGNITYASAGHLPPIVIAPDGSASFLELTPSVPIGVATNPVYPDHTVDVPFGSSVVLYTDGLVEKRGMSIDSGLAHLREIAASGATDPDRLCDALLAALVPGDPTDDVAMLVVRPMPLLNERVLLTLPAESSSVALARHTVARALREAGATEHETFEVCLATSEAVANSVEHAYGSQEGTVDLELFVEPTSVWIVVRDAGRWRAPRGENRGRGIGLMRSVMDTVDILQERTGTELRMRRTIGVPAGVDA